MGAKLKQLPSANWLALQKVGELVSFRRRGQIFKVLQEINPDPSHRRKRRKLGHETAPEQRGEPSSFSMASAPTQATSKPAPPAPGLPTGMKNGESIDSLRRMILGELEDQYTDHQKQYVSKNRTPQSLGKLIHYKDREDTSPSTVKWLVWALTARSLRSRVLAS